MTSLRHSPWIAASIAVSVTLIALSTGTSPPVAQAAAPAVNAAAAQQAWKKLQSLAGEWTGSAEGTPGKYKLQRSYELILKDQFVYTKSISQFEGKGGDDGERHEDWGFYSYDNARGTVVLRQFLGEGYINQYVLEEISDDGTSLKFVTESVENGMPGLRARVTLHLTSGHEIDEVLDLAFPGQDFALCLKTTLKRKR